MPAAVSRSVATGPSIVSSPSGAFAGGLDGIVDALPSGTPYLGVARDPLDVQWVHMYGLEREP